MASVPSAAAASVQLDPSTAPLVKDALARCSSGASVPLPTLGELISAELVRSYRDIDSNRF
ncbi:hypothetical protein OG21DRAFT_1509936 [Imleria badia]|nr:hypothetical protein OG21DRAFT_1509936 [Imleria badia]